jgi:hypothetical protein
MPCGKVILSGRFALTGADLWTWANGLRKNTGLPVKRKGRYRAAAKKIIQRRLDNFIKIYYNTDN